MLGKEGEKNRQSATETELERLSQLGLPKLASFIYLLAEVVSLLCQCADRHSYTAYITDLFLLEI